MEGEGIEMKSPDVELQNDKGDPDATMGSSGQKRKRRELASLATAAADRPARERKSIERFIVSPDKEVKEFKIRKGAGTALKDIPNIVFKLSKRRGGDEVVQLLHRVLFGKTSKHHVAKANILQFSGYVWSGNEEKEKAKVKERLERCVKESLHQISDLLDLPMSKSLKKEDGVLKVFEFLESPHRTSDKLVEEIVKAKKSKKAKKKPVKGSKKKPSGKSPRKSPKSVKKTSRSKKPSSDEEDESDDVPDYEDNVEENVDEEREDKSDDDYVKESVSSKKRKRKSPEKESVLESEDEEETLPRKKKPIKELKKGKEKPIQVAKKEKGHKVNAEEGKEPSDEDLQQAICELLQDADFSKVTFTDVMKQLGQKFNTNLTHRKAQLKAMIHEEIHKLVGEGDNEDENVNNDGEIDDNGDKVNRDEQWEQENATRGDPKANDEKEEDDENAPKRDGDDSGDDKDGDDEKEEDDENAAERDGDDSGDDKDGDDEKPDEDEEDGNSVEDKPDGDNDVENVKEEEDHNAAEDEEDLTEMA